MSYKPAPEPTDKSDVLDQWEDGSENFRIVITNCGRDVRVDTHLSDGWYVASDLRVVDVLVGRIITLRAAGRNLVRALEVFK